MEQQIRNIKIDFVDVETGEVLYQSVKQHLFYFSCKDKGGNLYLHNIVDSICRAVCSGRSVSVQISTLPLHDVKQLDIF